MYSWPAPDTDPALPWVVIFDGVNHARFERGSRHPEHEDLHQVASIYPEAHAPAIGISRTRTITNNRQAFNFTTFSDVGVQDPGGGISEAAFRAAPPPLE